MDARPGIAHCYKDIFVVLLRADQQLSRLSLNRAHGLDRVQDQIQHDLLQLNAIAVPMGNNASESRVWTETRFFRIADR